MENMDRLTSKMKQFSTIGCCGIDCGLCPRYHTDSPSASPGCGAPDFRDKHPSCGFITCCVNKHGFETCADCPEFPCTRFDAERKGLDSFVTHRKVFDNLNAIRDDGLNALLDRQSERIDLLKRLLMDHNDGRSKSYFCLACALLPEEALPEIRYAINFPTTAADAKEKNRRIKKTIDSLAERYDIELKLRKG